MLVSKTSKEDLLRLPPLVQEKIIYGGISTEMQDSDVAILLGGPLEVMESRAMAAVKLFKAGKVKYILPTGAPVRDSEFGKLSECDILIAYLKREGVPDEVIIPERQALTTQENMIFAALQISRNLSFWKARKVTVVSSYSHVKRGIALAKNFLPNSVTVYGYPSTCEEELPGNWFNSKTYCGDANYELPLIKGLIECGRMEDIEY